MAAPLKAICFQKIPIIYNKISVPAICNHGVNMLLSPCQPMLQQTAGTKAWNPKYKKERAMKTFKMDLPDFEKLKREANASLDEQRSRFKKDQRSPPRVHRERDMSIASTGTVFEAFVPPEGDGVASALSGEGAKQRLSELQMKGKSFKEVRKVKQFEENFDTKVFPDMAMDIYLEVHDLLHNIKDNEDRLHDLVTEKAYPEMTWRLDKTTYRWQFMESIEPPRVVHVRTTHVLSKDNVYAQVTVRFHTKQTFALYDRFGRLMYGSESLAKDCLDYVVFEKHVADENGSWRIHGKIIPDWMKPRDQVLRTKRMPPLDDLGTDEDDKEKKEDSKDSQTEEQTSSEHHAQPAMAT